MDAWIALFAGISAKVYDDIIDNKITISDTVKESLKGTQWMSYALLSVNDFNFTLGSCIIYTANSIADPPAYTTSYEQALLYTIPLLLLFNVDSLHALGGWDMMVILFMILILVFEPMIISENVSYRKCGIRLIGAIEFLLIYWWSDYFQISRSIQKMCLYLFGYTITSVFFQLYFLLKEPEVKEPEVKEVKG